MVGCHTARSTQLNQRRNTMVIMSKTECDPVADLHMPDAYMRWALLAAEEVTGKQGLAVVLRQAGLERLINNYPSDQLVADSHLTCNDYVNFFSGLMGFYGRAGKSMLLRIGRLSAQRAIQQQGALFGLAAILASKVLPTPAQLKMGMENMQGGFRKIWGSFGQEMELRIEDRGNKLAYVAATCPMCAGVEADQPICLTFTGTLQEATHWVSGQEFEVEEVECRATGAPACVWEVSKTPKM
jgi:predicted hydrocarbon binding protein